MSGTVQTDLSSPESCELAMLVFMEFSEESRARACQIENVKKADLLGSVINFLNTKFVSFDRLITLEHIRLILEKG